MSDLYITAAPGLHDPNPDPALWREWKGALSTQEWVVYLCLRWLVTQPGFSGEMTLRKLSAATANPRWGARGQIPQTQVQEAIRDLGRKGLLEVQDDDEQWQR